MRNLIMRSGLIDRKRPRIQFVRKRMRTERAQRHRYETAYGAAKDPKL